MLKYGNIQIYITGHSLGGAVAVLSALDVRESFSNTMAVYSYGQPRLGNDQLAQYIASKL